MARECSHPKRLGGVCVACGDNFYAARVEDLLRLVDEHAIYRCPNGHDQEHSGRCKTCGRTTDLHRWEKGEDEAP